MQEGSSLTIYGQPNGDGALIATGDSGQAGIGGLNGGQNKAPITITIHGGNIQATGGGGGAGIGCAGPLPSSITIYGGTVTAQGGINSAGIGGGSKTPYYTVNIYGGNITASRYAYHDGYGIRGRQRGVR